MNFLRLLIHWLQSQNVINLILFTMRLSSTRLSKSYFSQLWFHWHNYTFKRVLCICLQLHITLYHVKEKSKWLISQTFRSVCGDLLLFSIMTLIRLFLIFKLVHLTSFKIISIFFIVYVLSKMSLLAHIIALFCSSSLLQICDWRH